MKTLLAFNEEQEGMAVEDAFGLTFQASVTDATGSKVTFELREGGEAIPVTSANREVIEENLFIHFSEYLFFCSLGIRSSLQ